MSPSLNRRPFAWMPISRMLSTESKLPDMRRKMRSECVSIDPAGVIAFCSRSTVKMESGSMPSVASLRCDISM